jgi:hypothetical protein
MSVDDMFRYGKGGYMIKDFWTEDELADFENYTVVSFIEG